MIGIHPLHRQLAKIIHMSTDSKGNTVIGPAEIKLILPLLKQNLMLVQRLDELKNLAFLAHCSGDLDWELDITAKIEQIENSMLWAKAYEGR